MGYMQVLATARQKFWIIGGAKTARNAIYACLVCRRVGRMPVSQNMADLPSLRCDVTRSKQLEWTVLDL